MKTRLALLFVSLCLMSTPVWSQLCQGSLGDPIVNITFGAGNNPGPPLTAATTNYQYLTTDCPNDGQYAVRNRSDNCYTTWHTITSDHTGDPGGYFMLVNASFQPSAFYLDTVDLFCSNTIYEFAAWAINMMRLELCQGAPSIPPNLSFFIERTDGTVIQSYNTGDIPIVPTPTWNQYGFFFTAPPGENRVVLRIVNNAPGGCGNDIAIDDITFRPCGPLVTSSINGSQAEWNVCKGETAQLSLGATVSSGFTNPVYQWQLNANGGGWQDIPNANMTTLSIGINPATPEGVYLYRLSVSQPENVAIPVCRVNSAILTVRVNPLPVLTITNDSPACENGEVQLGVAGAATYNWTGPNSFSATGNAITLDDAQVNESGKYYVTGTSTSGCENIDSTIVTINPRPIAAVGPEEISICEGESVNLTSAGGQAYEWKPSDGLSDPGIANPIATPTDSVKYMVIVTNAFGCSDSAYSQINVLRNPFANAGADREIFEGQTITLNGEVGGTEVSYEWTPDYAISDPLILQPTVRPLVDTNYILTVTSSVGCGEVSDTMHVQVFKGIFVPTAFSPNNDGLNDEWMVPGLGIYEDHEVLVFNRYGQVVFSTKSNQPWDGRFKGEPQPAGVYPYLIKIKEENILLKGWIMIVR